MIYSATLGSYIYSNRLSSHYWSM